MSAVEPEPHGLFSHHHSHRGSNRHYEYLVRQAESLCLLPSSMRVLCAILCSLLICSLAAAIFNSLQGNSQGSKSFCKLPDEPFRPDVLCPRETMFYYYKCCATLIGEGVVCCAKVRIWLLIAIVCVTLSCVIALSYTIFHYCCVCDRDDDIRLVIVERHYNQTDFSSEISQKIRDSELAVKLFRRQRMRRTTMDWSLNCRCRLLDTTKSGRTTNAISMQISIQQNFVSYRSKIKLLGS